VRGEPTRPGVGLLLGTPVGCTVTGRLEVKRTKSFGAMSTAVRRVTAPPLSFCSVFVTLSVAATDGEREGLRDLRVGAREGLFTGRGDGALGLEVGEFLGFRVALVRGLSDRDLGALVGGARSDRDSAEEEETSSDVEMDAAVE
jgi:hypothetical protein